ncbi:sensor histidine kinase [Spirochaeta africana]|uniref:histidine kinase n=1 Tax=Spirochaeta africana (strain ATCC 700263 / DSM 8902 / Z-7692) TaxID=889378 RepID=H9UFD5_SPIAZ|nr:histidine kinase dimerization/phosphoacceptor domain -containing protein [Spirochaeta africana]AFG36228.1 PAS domain S-box [Spirochaeta africana DSM 8902]
MKPLRSFYWRPRCPLPERKTAQLILLCSLFCIAAAQVAGLDISDWQASQLYQQTSVVMLLIDPTDGRIVHANPAAAEFYGYPAETLESMNVADLNIADSDTIRRNISAATKRAENQFRFTHRLADNSLREVEIYSWPIEMDSATVLFSIVTDITEEQQARQQLEQERLRLERAEEIASFGHWVFHLDTGTVEVSRGAERIYGLENPPFTIAQVQKVPLDQYRAALDRAMADLIEGNAPYDIRFRIRRINDGNIRHIHSIAEYDAAQNRIFGIIHDYTSEALARQDLQRRTTWFIAAILAAAAAQLLIILGLVRAIWQRRAAEQHVRRMVREKDMLLREVHHRIKNNMGTIMNLLSLQADTMQSQEAVDALEESRSRVGSMLVIYDKLYRSGQYGQLSVQDYLESLTHEVRETFASGRRITLQTDIQDFPMDAQQLFHLGILTNELLTNAIKYAFPDQRPGEIHITASRSADNLAQLEIRDNGIGLPETAVPQGSGFGLELVDILVQQLDGRLQVHRNRGTTFRVEFPAR